MGVRGLTSFVIHNPSLWTSLPKAAENGDGKMTKLVIDAAALVFHVQYHNKIEWRYDGDYKRFARCVRDCFNALGKSGYELFVVINGLASEAKLEHHMSRENEAIQRVSRLIAPGPGEHHHHHKGKEILPKLAFQTFLQVVKEQKVPHTVCDGDADKTMAWMARTKGYAVVSNDSDCFILENLHGFIQLESLRITPQGATGRLFLRDKFAQHLGISTDLLPLLAAIVGNDHATDAELRRLQRLIYQKYSASVAQDPAQQQQQQQQQGQRQNYRAANNYKHTLIRTIGAFLAEHGDADKAIAEVKAMLSVPPEPKPKAMWGDEDHDDGPPGLFDPSTLEPRTEEDCAAEADRVAEIITAAADKYVKVPEGDDKRDYLGPSSTELMPMVAEEWHEGRFPDALIESFRAGDFDWKCMQLLCRRKFWGHTLIENVFEKPSVYVLPRPLRQLAYGVLFSGEDTEVTEYVREGLQFGPVEIASNRKAPGGAAALPHLQEVISMSASERRALLMSCLATPGFETPASVSALPLPFMLPVSLVRWWLANSEAKVSVYDLVEILACLVVNDDAVGSQRMPPRYSRFAAHLCSTWAALIEAGNLLNTSLMIPVPCISPPLACDGALVHILHDQLRRNKDIHAVVSHFVTDVEPFWMIFEAASSGLADKIDGALTRNDEKKLTVSEAPKADETIAAAATAAQGGAYDPNFARGGPHRGQRGILGVPGKGGVYGNMPAGYAHPGMVNPEEEARKREEQELLQTVKPGYDAAVKRTNVQKSKKSTVANAFAELLGGDDDDAEGSADEAAKDGDDDDEEDTSKTAEEIAAYEAEVAAKLAEKAEKKKKKKKQDDGNGVDDLLAELEALDAAKEEKKAKAKEKKKAKKKGKK